MKILILSLFCVIITIVTTVGARELEPLRPPPLPLVLPSGKAKAAMAMDGNTTLRELVLWTAGAAEAAGGAEMLQVLVDEAVDDTNAALAESGVPARLNVVHRQQVENFVEQNFEADLQALVALEDGTANEAHWLIRWHRAHHGTLVVSHDDACGIAYVMTEATVEFERYSWAVVSWACLAGGTLTHAHEWGHTAGLAHDDLTTGGDPELLGVHPYGKGHVWNGGADRTVMAYVPPGHMGPSTRHALFSTPLRTVAGVPAGVADTVDAARAFRETLAVVAEFNQQARTRWTVGAVVALLGGAVVTVGFAALGVAVWRRRRNEKI